MTREEAKRKMNFLKEAYQKLIDEGVDNGTVVGTGVRGTWKSNTTLTKAYEDMIDACDVAIKALDQEPCEDCISRTALMIALIDKGLDQIQADDLTEINQIVTDLPSIQPDAKIGHWFYDKSIENWRCSECKETPKTMEYCGSANFMAEHFKFCNHCGARIVEPQESEDKE